MSVDFARSLPVGCTVSENKENLFSFSSSWKNLRTLYGFTKEGEPFRFDLRLAFGDVTREDLVDFIDYSCLSGGECKRISEYQILYLGKFAGQIPDNEVDNRFSIDRECRKIKHFYYNPGGNTEWDSYIKDNYSKEYYLLDSIQQVEDIADPLLNEKQFGLRTLAVVKRDLPGKPLISVIIPAFNCESTIEQALQSAFAQTYDNSEIIVVDGGSTDSTPAVVRKYADKIDLFNSEPDKNIFDAINKGTFLSNGRYSVFIGSDDILVYNALEIIAEKISRHGEKDFFFGNGLTLTENGIIKRDNCFVKGKRFSDIKIYHPALYIKRDAFVELNGFDTDLFITSDFDFELKLISGNRTFEKAEAFLCIYRGGGHSSRFLWEKIRQVYKSVKHYNAFDFAYFIFLVCLILKFYLRKITGEKFFNKIARFRHRSTKK